jgi:hypothetical protein
MERNNKFIANLEYETRLFTRYLINSDPDRYILGKYVEAHRQNRIHGEVGHFDNFILQAARKSFFLTKLADSYTTVFYRKSILRKKFILLLAILESCAPTCHCIDSSDNLSKLTLTIKMFQKSAIFSIALFLATIVFMPVHIITSLISNNIH